MTSLGEDLVIISGPALNSIFHLLSGAGWMTTPVTSHSETHFPSTSDCLILSAPFLWVESLGIRKASCSYSGRGSPSKKDENKRPAVSTLPAYVAYCRQLLHMFIFVRAPPPSGCVLWTPPDVRLFVQIRGHRCIFATLSINVSRCFSVCCKCASPSEWKVPETSLFGVKGKSIVGVYFRIGLDSSLLSGADVVAY